MKGNLVLNAELRAHDIVGIATMRPERGVAQVTSSAEYHIKDARQ